MLKAIPFLLLLTVGTASVPAGNWTHWRGPTGNGTAPEATPPVQWSATENVKWKVEVPGLGSGSPIIWQDQVFVTSAVPVENATGGGDPVHEFVLYCYDRATGRLNWKRVANREQPHEGTHSTNGFASASPCTDGERVYAHFGSRGLYCYTMEGEPVWKRDLGDMTCRGTFGEGSSPTLAGDKIVVPWDHEGQSHLFALDKRTGETIWDVERDEPTCWATPLVIEHNGNEQIIMNGQNYARAYDLETGRELWRCGGQTQRPVACPVTADGLVFIGSGFRGSFLGAFRPSGSGDIAGSANVVWTIERDTPDIASFLLSEGRLYFYKAKSGLLTCVDAKTGEPHYSTQRIGLGTIYASPVAANGYVYLTDRDGKTVVIEDSPELKVVATNTVDETVDSTPAPVDNQMFVRGEKHLFCFEKP